MPSNNMVSSNANRAVEIKNNVSPSKQEAKLAKRLEKKEEKEARKARRKSENDDDWDPCEDIRPEEIKVGDRVVFQESKLKIWH